MTPRPHALLAGTLVAFLLACGGGGVGEGGLPTSVAEAHELCAQKDPRGCAFLAMEFEPDMVGGRKAHPEAFETYVTVSCDEGLGTACYELGFLKLSGEGGRVDKRAAAAALEKGCDAGEGRACFTGGTQLRRGDGVPKSSQKALEMFEKACDLLQDFKSCAEVGQMWTTTEIAGGPNPETSKSYYDKACDVEPDHPFCKGG